MDNKSLPFHQKSTKIYIENGISGGIYMEKKLWKRIEGLRERLNKFGLTRNLTDTEVVEVSQQLDCLLNQYQRLISYKQLSFW